MVEPDSARLIGKTVRVAYVGTLFGFVCLTLALGTTSSAFALSGGGGETSNAKSTDGGSSGVLGKTLGGLTDKTVPAVTKAVTDTTAPITDAVSPSVTKTVDAVVAPVSDTVVPAVTNTVEKVATPVVDTVGTVAPVIPAVVDTVDTVAAPITNDVAPAAVKTVDAVVTPVTTAVGDTAQPIVGVVTSPITPVTQTPAPVVPAAVQPITSPNRIALANPTNPLVLAGPIATITGISIAADHTPVSEQSSAGLSGLFSILPTLLNSLLLPLSWALDGTDVNQVISLWLKIIATLALFVAAFSAGGIYKKLRDAQKGTFLVSDELMFSRTLTQNHIKTSAISVTAIMILAIIIISIVLKGT
jgi:hypothetical protein